FNVSGNPGMATAGSGDVLTGILSGLLAQGFPPQESALLGAYLHGLAGDLAAETLGERSLMASDIVKKICSAMQHFR
ncbi:MAG: bifunctional ADP-dependent NAD(P)H-hydrate dehydratase/NAD(P)H-hydrate epimerase, partial [Bacteroidales bacterium]|nr:bifunctional ADP-dependent NAD(P)H-hydrate dehydratase/NAD(P)H-hydrate epimerase [Bacteroidales bacterium]